MTKVNEYGIFLKGKETEFIGFPKNRYEALDQVQDFLEFNGVDLGQAFEVLLTSNDGMLTYWFGDIEVQFARGFGVWSGSHNAVQMSIKLENDRTNETAVYEYKLRDLRLVRRAKLESRGLKVKW